MTIAELASGQYKERVNKKAIERSLQLVGFWRQYETGRIANGIDLLDAVSEDIGRPTNALMVFLADPDDPYGSTIEDNEMEVDQSG